MTDREILIDERQRLRLERLPDEITDAALAERTLIDLGIDVTRAISRNDLRPIQADPVHMLARALRVARSEP